MLAAAMATFPGLAALSMHRTAWAQTADPGARQSNAMSAVSIVETELRITLEIELDCTVPNRIGNPVTLSFAGGTQYYDDATLYKEKAGQIPQLTLDSTFVADQQSSQAETLSCDRGMGHFPPDRATYKVVDPSIRFSYIGSPPGDASLSDSIRIEGPIVSYRLQAFQDIDRTWSRKISITLYSQDFKPAFVPPGVVDAGVTLYYEAELKELMVYLQSLNGEIISETARVAGGKATITIRHPGQRSYSGIRPKEALIPSFVSGHRSAPELSQAAKRHDY
jgi:hypothetical protein